MLRNIKDIKQFNRPKSEDFHFELIDRYFRNKKHGDILQTLSDKTCSDLDFDELFMYLDRTHSKVGQQFLYNKLRRIPIDDTFTKRQENTINKIENNPALLSQTIKSISKLDATEAYYITSLFQEEQIKPPLWFYLVPILSFSCLLLIVLMFFNPVFLFVLILNLITNLAIHYRNKKNLYPYLSSIPQLLKLRSVALKLHKDFKELNPDLNKAIKTIDQIRVRMSFFHLEAKIQSDSEALVWSILEMIKIPFLLEPLLLFSVLKRLDNKKNEIEDVFAFVGEIDSAISVSSLRKGLSNYCIPSVNHQPQNLSAQDAYHPLINNCVGNSLQVNNKSVLLTGSNMSGKTSFIRTIGINVITGLTINTCFAKSITFPRMRIYSAIRISDDLMNDKSYYFAEVLSIKNMIGKSKDNLPNLFLLDEIFKGTNTVERISAGKAVLSHLTSANNLVFVSTHDIELTDMLTKQYDLYHFSEVVNNKNVDFDYKLKHGKLTNRNAIKILEINGYPQSITDEARKLAGDGILKSEVGRRETEVK